MLEVKNKIISIIDLLENKPGFFFASNNYSYNELKSFLLGYLTCLDESYNFSINIYFSEWLNKKYKKTSLFWSEYINEILAENNDKQAIEILFREFRHCIDSLDSGI